MPILAICRGTQALNIVRGGALYQHLPDLSDELAHRQTNPGTEPSHPVVVDADSQLWEAFGGGEIEVTDVNSFHHQAIDRLGQGLRVSARAPDGTIEAVEDPSRRFLIGVQWHAETLVHRAAEAELFRRFVDACRDDSAEYEQAAARREVA
jgi:putative glutamine amidotransferase